jgi:hypothetical protein
MARPFTVIGAIVLLIVAAVHTWRVTEGLPVMVAGHDIPMQVSWAAAAISGFLGMMLIVELRR